mmetsp:Transcript_22079/g.37867  ORF Transcript_22079/g.37867 Transcript_22079/m.37867 type:complete len:106 (+) Transcript_22079:2083-2400(+)
MIPIGDKHYLNDNITTKRWYDFDFISGFAALVAHEAHHECHARSYPSTQLVHCHHPNTVPRKNSCISLSPGKKRIISVLHHDDHYSVMVIETDVMKIQIFDGLTR